MKNGIQFPVSYRTDKACGRFNEFMHKDIMQETARSLSNARVISICLMEPHMFQFVKMK